MPFFYSVVRFPSICQYFPCIALMLFGILQALFGDKSPLINFCAGVFWVILRSSKSLITSLTFFCLVLFSFWVSSFNVLV